MVKIIVFALLLLCIVRAFSKPHSANNRTRTKSLSEIEREHKAIMRDYKRKIREIERNYKIQQREDELRARAQVAGVHLATFYEPASSSDELNTTYIENELSRVDRMDGHSFEIWCADLLDKIGYTDVQITPGSGDQGVDIICERDGKKYAIQCKCYHSDLGNKPIQEVTAGRIFYDCDYGIVMTNMHFTQGAIELANKVGISLCDRDTLINMLNEYVAIN